jgi:hypothetical protein
MVLYPTLPEVNFKLFEVWLSIVKSCYQVEELTACSLASRKLAIDACIELDVIRPIIIRLLFAGVSNIPPATG